MLTREIGSTFILDNKLYEVAKGYLSSQCHYCSLKNVKCYSAEIASVSGSCSPAARADKNAVIFKELSDAKSIQNSNQETVV